MNNTVSVHNTNTQDRDPLLRLSEAAIQHVQRQLHNHPEYTSIRFSTKVAGCSGMKYLVDFIEAATEDDEPVMINADLTIFVDKESIPFIRGTLVDYVRDEQKLGHVWKFSNPKATGSCGCGESFTIG